jgi:hypothetical protein
LEQERVGSKQDGLLLTMEDLTMLFDFRGYTVLTGIKKRLGRKWSGSQHLLEGLKKKLYKYLKNCIYDIFT